MKRFLHVFPKFIYLLSLFALLTAMGFIALYLAVGPSLPDVDSIRKIQLQSPMRVYSSDKKLIAEFGNKKRIPITLDQVPQNFINALLATEDERFYQHSGVDFLGVLRAVQRLIVTQTKSQGASTITMQVARNYYLTRAKRFSRKFTEMFLAWKIESELSKNEILELYLNKIPFGHRSFGLGAAAQVYYGNKLDNLTLAQLATLAGIPKGPSVFNPISNPTKTRVRRKHVLGRMLQEGHIDQQQYDSALAEPVATVRHTANITAEAHYFAEMVRREAIKRFGVDATYHGGLNVYTTLDSNLQQFAKQATVEALEEYDRRHGYRGPERKLDLNQFTDRQHMQQKLSEIDDIAGLQPALVINVNDQLNQAEILLKPKLQPITKQEAKLQLSKLQSESESTTQLLQAGLSDKQNLETDFEQVSNKHLNDGESSEQNIAILKLDDLLWARQFVDENHRGPTIKAISEVLSVGDVIRVRAELTTAEQLDNNTPEHSNVSSNNYEYKLVQIPQANAGFVSLNPENGAIQALVGGYDYFYKKFNSVTQANRQLGSNIKPFVYSAAFAKGFTPASIINDMPIVEEDITAENFWRPKNDGDNYAGPTTLRVGLRHSKNTVSIRLIRKIGARYTKQYLTNIGFPADNMQPYYSLALGSASFTPLEVVSSYAVLANGGYKVNPWFIDRVEDSNGEIIQQHQPVQVCRECEVILNQSYLAQQKTSESNQDLVVSTTIKATVEELEIEDSAEFLTPEDLLPIPKEYIAPRVIDKRNLYLIDHILKDVIHRGTAYGTLARAKSNLLKRNDISGKTGTTNDAKDAWFSGYNTKHVATAWVGFDDHSKKLGTAEWGGKAALPIWQKFMQKALENQPEYNHPRPEGIVTVRIDPKTGLLATSQTEQAIFELFRSENAPTEQAEQGIQDIFNQSNEKVEEDSLF
jgi:penicillin-binding protein 1A